MKEFLVLDVDTATDIGPKDRSWDSVDQNWFFINSGVWFIYKGTIWDGATAVPDGREDPNKEGYPILWLATLIHDLGYMFMHDPDFPYSRREIDDMFRDLMEQAGFKFTVVYYLGVRWFGGVWDDIFNTYRRVFNKERQLPAHISEYGLELSEDYNSEEVE